jgi:hypothetical protein
MRLTNRYLARTYAELNKKYFRNRLPKDMVVRFVTMNSIDGQEDDAHTRVYWNRPAYIVINKRNTWSATQTDMALIHEMVHVENPKPNGHGSWFQKRMLKLAKAGAFKGRW